MSAPRPTPTRQGVSGAAVAVPPCAGAQLTGLADAVLREIETLLAALIETGADGAVDLRSLPMTDADRADLKRRLGVGEVRAALEISGPSSVEETEIPGVWWIRHEDGAGQVASELIAVTRVPEILISHPDDIAAGAGRLRALIEDGAPHETPQDTPKQETLR